MRDCEYFELGPIQPGSMWKRSYCHNLDCGSQSCTHVDHTACPFYKKNTFKCMGKSPDMVVIDDNLADLGKKD